MLSKLASTSFDHLTKEVFVEILPARSFESKEVTVMGVDQPNWMKPYFDYLMNDILPKDDVDVRKTKIKSLEYTFHNGTLYRKIYLAPWIKCITQQESKFVLQETHVGEASTHEGARALVENIST